MHPCLVVIKISSLYYEGAAIEFRDLIFSVVMPNAQVAVQDPQMAQHSVAAQYGAPDLALQQQMAAQGRLPGGLLA